MDGNIDFEDDRALLNKEARLRRYVQKIFNKRRDDFKSDHEHDDYLEMVEDIIFNLLNDTDVSDTKAKIEQYRRENQDLIGQNQARKVDEDRRAVEILAQSERDRMTFLAELRRKDAEAEQELRRKRLEEELEEMRRVSLGPKELARLKKEQEKKERREKRRIEQERAAVEAKAKAAEPDTRPMFFRPAFPNPPPQPLSDYIGKQNIVVSLDRRAAAGGYLEQTSTERDLLEYSQALQILIKHSII